MFIHGGGWQGGDKSAFSGYYARLYANAGFHVVSINYTLASYCDPTTQWNAQLQDAQEAIRLLREKPFDLVLLDLGLPGMNGFELLTQLKELPETQAIPIIALTAHAMAGDREKCLEAGCNDYDTKPVEFPRLLGKIQEFLGK